MNILISELDDICHPPTFSGPDEILDWTSQQIAKKAILEMNDIKWAELEQEYSIKTLNWDDPHVDKYQLSDILFGLWYKFFQYCPFSIEMDSIDLTEKFKYLLIISILIINFQIKKYPDQKERIKCNAMISVKELLELHRKIEYNWI